MGYTNAIIRVDPVNGSDTALSNLTGVSFSWNTGTSKMRGTYTAHQLTTGQIIQVSGSSGLNDYWKVTVIDANTFDLDLSPNVANTTGTVTPYRGATWAQAFATFNTSNWPFFRAGDEVRIAKTPLVQTNVSATWTNNSAVVSLASNSLIKLIQAASSTSGWVAATNVSLSNLTGRKYGNSSVLITANASFTTGKLAHFTLSSSLDLSAYNTLNLWLYRFSGTIAASSVRVALCSDSNGNTPVDEVILGHELQSSAFYPMVLKKTALGSNINSIAVYADSNFASRAVAINNIFASTGLSLLSVIGGNNMPFFAVDSADDTTINIGSPYSASIATPPIRFGFNTVTTNLWYYEKYQMDVTVSGMVQTIFAASKSNTLLEYAFSDYKFVGGYNTSNDTRDGRTVLTAAPLGSSPSLYPTLFAVNSSPEYIIGASFEHIHFNRLGFSDFNYSASGVGTYSTISFDNCAFSANPTGITAANIFPLHRVLYTNCDFSVGTMAEYFNNVGNTTVVIAYVTAPKIFRNCRFNVLRRLLVGNWYFRDCVIGEHASEFSAITRFYTYGLDAHTAPRFINCTFQGNFSAYNDSLTNVASAQGASFPATANCSGTPSNYVFTGPCMRALWQTAEKHPNDNGAYEIEIGGFCATGKYHTIRVMQVAASTSTVSIKARVKKNHATNVDVALMVDMSETTATFSTDPSPVTAANNTSWQEITLNVTPTAAGIITIDIGIRSSVSTSSTTKVFLGSVYA